MSIKTRTYYEIHSARGNISETSDRDDVQEALSKSRIVIEVQESVFYTTEAVIKTTVSRHIKPKAK